MRCRFCDSTTKVFLDFTDIPISVTSDARIVDIGIKLFICNSCDLIQKDSTELLQKNYFGDFHSHSISDGVEQVKFINGVATPRSEVILSYLRDYIAQSGELLDIGTGNGSFLKAFRRFFLNWKLFGQDIQSNSISEVIKIIPKENYYVNDIKEIKHKYDVISIIGVLGHIPNLKEFLSNLKNISKNETKIIIQTPDIQKSFFDIVIIDHITYFNKSMLHRIMSEYFKNISFIDTVHKEITLGTNFSFKSLKFDAQKEMQETLAQAEIFKKLVKFLNETKEAFIMFGSAPVSTYLAAVLKENLICFIDEDETRLGKSHLNKLILHPNEIDVEKKIILPFSQEDIITNIKQRYPLLSFISFKDI